MPVYSETDVTLLEKEVETLGISEGRKIRALSELRQIGDDSTLYRSIIAGQPRSKTRKKLERLDNAATKLLEELGGTGELEDLENLMDRSSALSIPIFNVADS